MTNIETALSIKELVHAHNEQQAKRTHYETALDGNTLTITATTGHSFPAALIKSLTTSEDVRALLRAGATLELVYDPAASTLLQHRVNEIRLTLP